MQVGDAQASQSVGGVQRPWLERSALSASLGKREV